MFATMRPAPTDSAPEIGTRSGSATAGFARLVRDVHTVDCLPEQASGPQHRQRETRAATATLCRVRRLLPALFAAALLPAQKTPTFANGLPQDPDFFPLAVWLQAPQNAQRYQAIGINLYVGLFGGPTAAQLDALERAKMRVICAQNEVGLAHKGKVIVGWMHDDEPDNAQAATVGYGPPIEPWKVVEGYERMRKADPTRPVLLNLGQGAAWDGWYGRGVRTGHPEDYPEYLKGCDIGSFDIYPVTHGKPAVRGKLEFVGNGVRRMVGWGGGRKPVFACIETGHVDNKDARPTAQQVKDEVWMAITCGASGIVYFAHEFQPTFVEAGLLAHEEIAAAVKEVNAEVLALARVLHGKTVADAVKVTCKPKGEIALLCKHDGKDLVVFAASLSGEALQAVLRPREAPKGRVEVLGEKRACKVENGAFADDFAPYATHRYRFATP